MTEQVEKQAVEPSSDWVEIGAEAVPAEHVAEEKPAIEKAKEDESAELELVIDGQAVSPTADDDVNVPDDAPNWAKDLRTKYKETARKAAELEKQLQAKAEQSAPEPELEELPEPELADFDFDEAAYKVALKDWAKKQLIVEQKKADAEARQAAELEEINTAKAKYDSDRAKVVNSAPDYQAAEQAVVDTLSVPAQVMIMQLADNAASIVLAAGRNKALLAELKSLESNPIKLAAKIGSLNKSVGFAPKVNQQFEPEPKTKAAVTKPQSADDARFSAAFPDATFL